MTKKFFVTMAKLDLGFMIKAVHYVAEEEGEQFKIPPLWIAFNFFFDNEIYVSLRVKNYYSFYAQKILELERKIKTLEERKSRAIFTSLEDVYECSMMIELLRDKQKYLRNKKLSIPQHQIETEIIQRGFIAFQN